MATSRDAPTSDVVGTSKPRLLHRLGPGLIAGVANDDPVAIGSYSQIGARFGFGLCWLLILVYPIMVVVQQISGRVGRTTGRGLAGNLAAHYPAWLLYLIVLLLVAANVIALAADLSIMAEVIRSLVGGPRLLYVVGLGALCVALQIFMHYARYVAILKWITLSVLAYVGAVLLVGVPWGEVLHAILVPPITFDADYLTAIVAIFGVALSPYVFFWQASQEVEDQRVHPVREPLLERPEQAPSAKERIRIDTYVGMAIAVLVGFAILLTTATALHREGVTYIATAAQAAEALRPIAGDFAFIVFGIGILGTGLLAIPVLAGSAAYAVGEAFRVPVGLARAPLEAKAFYGAITAATLAGVAANFLGLDPIRALFWSGVVNGIVAAPVLAITVRLATRPEVMGDLTIGRTLQIGGWIAVAITTAGVLGIIVSGALHQAF